MPDGKVQVQKKEFKDSNEQNYTTANEYDKVVKTSLVYYKWIKRARNNEFINSFTSNQQFQIKVFSH